MRLKPTDTRAAGLPAEASPGRHNREPGSAAAGEGSIVVALSVDPAGTTAGIIDERLLDRQIQAAIGAQLRMLYNDIASAPVPEHLVQLLDKLAAKPDGADRS